MADQPLKVNFSEEEAQSETRLFKPMPAGFYKASVVKIEPAVVTNNTKGNLGKKYWKLTLRVQEDGEYNGRQLWSNVMLFEGALHTLAQLLKACGMGDLVKKGQIPNPESLIGKVVDVNVTRKHDKYQEDGLREMGDNSSVWKNDVKGFRAHEEAKNRDGSASLLPG